MKIYTLLLAILLTGCTMQHRTTENHRYTGDFRYYAGIAEFFDCKQKKRFYLSSQGLHDEVISSFQALKLTEKEDAFLKVEGYYTEEEQMDGVDPLELLVVTRIDQLDPSRSCDRRRREGL